MKVNLYGKISHVRNIPTGRKLVAFLIGTRSSFAFKYVGVGIEQYDGTEVADYGVRPR